MNSAHLADRTLRGCRLALTSGARKVKGGDKRVRCDVLTVVEAPTASSAPGISTELSSSRNYLSKYIWSFLAPLLDHTAQKYQPDEVDDLHAVAEALAASQALPHVSTHVKTASRVEVKNARLMSDLSNMAYDVSRVTTLSLFNRHQLNLVACSEIRTSEASQSSMQTPATPQSNLQSNIVPFPRVQRQDSNSSEPASPPAAAHHNPPTANALNTAAASLEGPLQWFIADTTMYPNPLRTFAIQGSVTLDHWKINLAFDPVDFESPELGIKVHRGVYQAALDLYPVFYPYVLAHLATHASAQVTFTGHSLGGSVATILMLLFVARGVLPPSAVFPIHTFGAPAVFCDGANPGVAHCSSCQLSCNCAGKKSKRKWSSCAGLLNMLGLPPSAVRNVVMHQDIVPRAFVCNYGHVAQLLQQFGPAFKAHIGLSASQPHKVLYNFIGTVHILQPDRRHKFCLDESYHHLLPAYPALYTVHGTDGCGSCDAHQAVLEFMNNPHPLQVLGSRAAYGTNGSISRYHNPDNYTKALFGLLKRW